MYTVRSPESKPAKNDEVNHPNHYNQGNIEVYDFIEDQKLDFPEGCVVKYVCRYKTKNGLKDLQKARWYLDKLISRIEKERDRLLSYQKTEEEAIPCKKI